MSGRREQTQDTDREPKNQGHLFSWTLVKKERCQDPTLGKEVNLTQTLYLDPLQILPHCSTYRDVEGSRIVERTGVDRLQQAVFSLSAMQDSLRDLRDGKQWESAPLRSDPLQPWDELSQETGVMSPITEASGIT